MRSTELGGAGYTVDDTTEVPYLFGHGVRLARVTYTDAADFQTERRRIFLELGDHLGSTSVVLDRATGELVERSASYAYGAAESHYRSERWDAFREDYRFTGKEDDIEVGLIYFGARYLNPSLNRWISADPLAVHAPGKADLNLYAYVHGKLLVAVDPVGLDIAEYMRGLAAGGVEAVKGTVRWAAQEHPTGQVVRAVQAAAGGDLSGTASHLVQAHPAVFAAKSVVGTAKSIVDVPGQIKDAATARNDYEAGKKAFAPSATIAGAVGALYGGVRGVMGKAGTVKPSVAPGESPATTLAQPKTGAARAAPAPAPTGGVGRGGTKLGPDPAAEGPHSTFKTDPQGKVTSHAEWKSNPKNPSGYDQVKRTDVEGAADYNKATGKDVPTPHTHEKGTPGGVRPATPDEVPRQ